MGLLTSIAHAEAILDNAALSVIDDMDEHGNWQEQYNAWVTLTHAVAYLRYQFAAVACAAERRPQ